MSSSSKQIKLPSKGAKQKQPKMPVVFTGSSLANAETENIVGNVTNRSKSVHGRKTDSPPPSAMPAKPILRSRLRKAPVIDRSPSPLPHSLQGGKRERGSGTGLSNNVRSSRSTATEKSAVPKVTVIAVPQQLPAVRNVQTSCKPRNLTVGVQCKPQTSTVGTQTDEDYSNKVLIPVPVPIYLPQPMYMYSAPFPVPVPIALPIPVPIFIPTTRDSAQGIMEAIKNIQDKMSANPFEADLMMAEMVAEEKHESDSDLEFELKLDSPAVSLQDVDVINNSYDEDVPQMALKMDPQDNDQPTSNIDLESGVTANITNPPPGMVQHDDSMSHQMSGHLNMQQYHMMDAQRYDEDVPQMALKMDPQDNDQPTSNIDLESGVTPNITNPPPGMVQHDDSMSHQMSGHLNMQQYHMMDAQRYDEDVPQMALKMDPQDNDQPTSNIDLESGVTANITNPPPGMVQHDDSMSHQMSGHLNMQQYHMMDAQRGGHGCKRSDIAFLASTRNSRSPVKRIDEMETAPQRMQPLERADVNMCLKYTFGVKAWKQWVVTRNAHIKKTALRRTLLKTELLHMRANELNYSLSLFVTEVRKPNGSEYAPDTIYYLVLGIQYYLYENGRIDNLFNNPCYEGLTDCLDIVACKFAVLYNDSHYIVTRVEEEHLWECKQLGAHSPHVLLSTVMFFNTKYFKASTVEEHMAISFSHILKYCKRTGPTADKPGSRNTLWRFYPPHDGREPNLRKRKVYEQLENKENDMRCPVRLYEFYLSKCPESVKSIGNVFYLQPEQSCVPDSPVWYSSQPLSQQSLQKKLRRVRMVKEINIALLESSSTK